jgi:hypothetical protein
MTVEMCEGESRPDLILVLKPDGRLICDYQQVRAVSAVDKSADESRMLPASLMAIGRERSP